MTPSVPTRRSSGLRQRYTPDSFGRSVREIGKPASEFESVKPLSDRARGERADRTRGAGTGVTDTRRDERHRRHGSRNHSKPKLTHQTCPSTGDIDRKSTRLNSSH